MKRKDRRARKFGHWSANRELYGYKYATCGIAAEIDAVYWHNFDKDISRYLLWEYTH